MYLQINKWLT